tara:strand:+ start:192 stop:614 length:423 start_codon:yes stop_codon:yes gene_type:complete
MADFGLSNNNMTVNSELEEITLPLPPGMEIPIEPDWNDMYGYNLEQISRQLAEEEIANYDGVPGSNINCMTCLLLGWKLGFKTGYSEGAMAHYNLRPQTPTQGVGHIVSQPSTPGGRVGGKRKRKTMKKKQRKTKRKTRK